jgi:hypothetical protein
VTCPDEVTFELFESDESMPEDEFFDAQDGPRGYCVAVKTPQGDLFLNSTEESEIGFATADDAIEAVKKWCLQRGYHPPFARFKLKATRQ